MANKKQNITKTVGKAIKAALKGAPKDTGLGPNAAFPFGIKITDPKSGNVSWERFKTAADRDKRFASNGTDGKRVNFAADNIEAPKPAAPAAPKAEAPKPAAPKAEAPKPAAPAAPKKTAPAAPKAEAPSEFKLHLNKTGRLCIGSEAAKRLGDAPYATLAIEGKLVRLIPQKKEVEGALAVKDAAGRPYVSATKQFKALGFDGSEPRDFTAKPYGTGGFEFRY
jgi:hypothetical protein